MLTSLRSISRPLLRSSSGYLLPTYRLSRPLPRFRPMSHHAGESAIRPEADKVLQDIADYVHNYNIDSNLAYETARLCLIDTIGCGLEGLRFPECTKLLGPVVEGTIVPNGVSALSAYYPLLLITCTQVQRSPELTTNSIPYVAHSISELSSAGSTSMTASLLQNVTTFSLLYAIV